MTDGAMIEAQRLCRAYPQGDGVVPVLVDVDLEVPAGRFGVVMGPSGSGKSTLLHCLGGLDPPTSGTVRLGGTELTHLDEEQRTLLRRRLVGFVFQFFNLVPNLTVAENVGLPLLLQGVKQPRDDARFRETVEFFGIEERLDRRPHQLSGGEMQRTSIARALVHRPRVVLADEPTGNLATRAGAEVMQFLRRAVDDLDQTVLLVTHNPRDAGHADELHFLVDGRIDPAASLAGDAVREDRIHQQLETLGI